MPSDLDELADIEDDMRDESKIPCPACGGTGENNSPDGWVVLQPVCTTCSGERLVRRGMLGPYTVVSTKAMPAWSALLFHPDVGAYRQSLLRGHHSMDGTTLSPNRIQNYGPSYLRSRIGLVQLLRQRQVSYGFTLHPNSWNWTDLTWWIGTAPLPLCANFKLLRLPYGDWCARCGHRPEQH